MSVNEESRDRSYQFGRLLAVLEKVERDTYSDDEGREPNAIRLQSVYCRMPLKTAAQIEAQLEKAYFPRLQPGARSYYKMLIGQILDRIHTDTEQSRWNAPLKETYLMGYYLQRKDLYTKKRERSENNEEEN